MKLWFYFQENRKTRKCTFIVISRFSNNLRNRKEFILFLENRDIRVTATGIIISNLYLKILI